MLEEAERRGIADAISARLAAERGLLDSLIQDLRDHGVKRSVRSIRAVSTTAMAIVASDGGNHSIRFDPFHHQLIRVVDSDGQTLALKPIALTTDLSTLFVEDTSLDQDGRLGPIGVLVRDLEHASGQTIASFRDLCPAINTDTARPEQTAGWVVAYRDLFEWAVLYQRLTRADFAQSTLVVRDGLLRTKLFGERWFMLMGDLLAERLRELRIKMRKDVRLVGLAKASSVIDLYRLALEMENVFPSGSPYYVRLPREIERRAYKFPEFARGRERLQRAGDGLAAVRDPVSGRLTSLGLAPEFKEREPPKFVFGTMFLARSGTSKSDPIWAIDVFDDQASDADVVLGHLSADATEGFPVPLYPQSLQRAHEAAKLTDLDAEILKSAVMEGIRGVVGEGNDVIVDRLQLAGDVAGRRY